MILLVHEYPESSQEWMMPNVASVLRRRGCGVPVVYLHGLSKTYRPGGLRAARLINLAYMALVLPGLLLLRRPRFTLIRSAPAGLHLWAAFWFRLLRLRAALWLMDYHPEIEARAFERSTFGNFFARLLRSWDRYALNSYERIIVLDQAMAQLVASRTSRPVDCFPTWGNGQGAGSLEQGAGGMERGAGSKEQEAGSDIDSNLKSPPSDLLPQVSGLRSPPSSSSSSLRLLYGGHLGSAHQLEDLESLLGMLDLASEVTLYVVGANQEGAAKFQAMADRRPQVTVEVEPRMPFDQLVEFTRSKRVHYGIVVMREDFGGLLSPSKFAGYLAADLPLLYLGPKHTNSWAVCHDFSAGVAFELPLKAAAVASSVKKLVDSASWLQMRDNVSAARQHFDAFTSERFVELIFKDVAFS